ncbi:MAG TPA: PAS domain S-box protein, partial [Roseiflexaceae bacterium]|nr:PAS domain S-box protein [Roseiflexaceae bacterium]
PINTREGLHILSSIVDITDRKQAEDALRAGELRFHHMIDSMLEGVQIIDFDWRYQYLNDGAIAHGRKDRSELLGRTMMECYPGIEQTELFQLLERCMLERTSARLENRFVYEDGSVSWFDLSIQPASEGIFVLSADITERKRIEEAIHEAEQKLRALFEFLPVGVSILNADRKVVYANSALGRILGLTREQLESGAYVARKYIRPDGSPMEPGEFASLRAAQEQRPIYDVETGIVREDGTVTWASVSAAPVGIADWRVVNVLTDITERKQADLQLRDYTRRLRVLADASRAFVEVGTDYQLVLDHIARTLVTLMGDGCIIALISDDGAWLQASHVYDVDPDVQELTRSLVGGRRRIEESTTNARVFQTGQPLLVPLVDRDQIRAAAKPEYAAMIERQAPHSLMVVPMRAFGRVISVLTLYRRQAERPPFDEDDLRLAQDLADRAALAIGNAQLFGQLQAELAERERAENALREREEYLRVLTETMPAVPWTATPEGQIDYFSQRWLELTGLTREEALGEGWMDVPHPDDRPQMIAAWSHALATGEPYDVLHRIRLADGSYRWQRSRALPQRDADSRIVRWHGITDDIHELRLAEERRRASEERFAKAFQGSPVAIVISRIADGEIVTVNDRFLALFGYEREAVIGRTSVELDLWADPGHRERVVGLLRAQGQLRDLDVRVRTSAGEIRDVLLSVEILDLGADGQSILTLLHDITDRKRAENALRASEERFAKTFRVSPAALVITRQRDRVQLDVNESYCELIGWSREELIGTTPMDQGVFVNPEQIADLRTALLTDQALRNREITIRTRKGDLRIVLFSAVGVTLNDEPCFLTIMVDITDRKRAEAALAEQTHELERSNAELEQFAYVASHDLQEPLRMVASYTELLGERYKGKLDERADKYINYAVDGARRMQMLVNDLLTFSRVGTHGKPLQPTDSANVVRHVLDGLRASIQESGATVEVGELPVVSSDVVQLGQLFQNLIGNAIKFHGAAPPHIQISARREADKWVFAVTDNGIGIDQTYSERIFQIFQRLHERGKYAGSGIGLALAKRIVDRHGGQIWFESAVGQGTTFFFTLPVVES